MKKTLYIVFSVILISVAGLLLMQTGASFGEPPLYIAAVGPMSGPQKANGRAMIRGINLYLDKINAAGGIEGREVRLRIFDDKTQIKRAMKVAAEIEASPDILLVLGHYYSNMAVAAGRIYRKSGVPAITASATANDVTRGNDWYFRTIPNNAFQGGFIAHYILNTLGRRSASIIYNTDTYGTSLAENFEKAAQSLGIEIRRKWGFDSDSKKLNEDFAKIVAELRTMDDPGALFFATYTREGVRIISSLKYPGTDYTIVGPDTFSKTTFIENLNRLPQEKASPGYYSDGIYATSPFMASIANKKSHEFRNRFMAKYDETPSWISACYYDATYVAIEAIRNAEILGNGKIRTARKAIRAYLGGLQRFEDAFQGITGPLYFDKNGDVNGPMAVGMYNRQRFFPAFSQYLLASDGKQSGQNLKKVLEGEMMMIEDKMMVRTHVVYTGIDINEVSDLDVRNSAYTIDFYLWFRYQGDFDATNIRFINAEQPITLNAPIVDRKDGDITVKAFHIKARFKSEFDFHAYPFDHQQLRIRFRHAHRTREELVYVVDALGMPESVDRKNIGKTNLNAITGWRVRDKSFYQDIISNMSTLGLPEFFDNQNTISYSRFNATVRIEKEGTGAVWRNFLPVIIMVTVLYMVFFIPPDRPGIRVMAIGSVLITNAFYHANLLWSLPVEYPTVAEYTVFGVYGLTGLTALITTLIFIFRKKEAHHIVRWLIRGGKIVFPLIALGSALFIFSGYIMI